MPMPTPEVPAPTPKIIRRPGGVGGGMARKEAGGRPKEKPSVEKLSDDKEKSMRAEIESATDAAITNPDMARPVLEALTAKDSAIALESYGRKLCESDNLAQKALGLDIQRDSIVMRLKDIQSQLPKKGEIPAKLKEKYILLQDRLQTINEERRTIAEENPDLEQNQLSEFGKKFEITKEEAESIPLTAVREKIEEAIVDKTARKKLIVNLTENGIPEEIVSELEVFLTKANTETNKGKKKKSKKAVAFAGGIAALMALIAWSAIKKDTGQRQG